MSCKELIEALRKAGDDKVKAIWQEAEEQGARVRAEVRSRIANLVGDADRKKKAFTAERINRAVSDANGRARILRLAHQKELSDRLYRQAVAALPGLRTGTYEQVFRAMVQELPAVEWETVRVNPEDDALARKLFPKANIVADAAISGGIDASARSGSLRIVNTFEKRLERAWGEMQPELIRDVYEEVFDGSTAVSAGQGVSGRVSVDENQGQAVTPD